VPQERTAVKQLECIGKEQGVAPLTLARQWILEHIPIADA